MAGMTELKKLCDNPTPRELILLALIDNLQDSLEYYDNENLNESMTEAIRSSQALGAQKTPGN